MRRIRMEQNRQREELRRQAQAAQEDRTRQYEEFRRQAAEVAEQRRRQAELEKEQLRQAREQERIKREQERQAEELAKHERQIAKLEQKISAAEGEIAFNNEQRDRLFKLLDIEERERDACTEGSSEWQKHHKKIISLENQIHVVHKRLDSAKFAKAQAEQELSA
ncbi:MAG: hypothetical protein J6V08_02775 [Candidatus Methanomethylophilaceae archaeon]|nr:hypothetical protein [Candidatus Methanomethylophilaceae archaeon]